MEKIEELGNEFWEKSEILDSKVAILCDPLQMKEIMTLWKDSFIANCAYAFVKDQIMSGKLTSFSLNPYHMRAHGPHGTTSGHEHFVLPP